MANDYGRKVARAARTGGGVTNRGDRPYGFYFVIFLICAIGIPLIMVSKNQRSDNLHPTGGDHWHSVLAWYNCDKSLKALDGVPEGQTQTPLPILHTHTVEGGTEGDGLVHVEPIKDQPSPYEGKKATLGAFLTLYPQYGTKGTLVVTKNSFQRPGEAVHKTGDKCDGKAATVKTLLWQPSITNVENKKGDVTGKKYSYNNGYKVFTGDPNNIRLRDGLGITIGLIPDGAKVPAPPTKQIDSVATAVTKSSTTTTTSKKTSTTKSEATTTTKAG